jgi:type I restriction enzyme R subunit
VKKLSLPTSVPERPGFRACDVEQPWVVPGYRRRLPHLRLEGATYFVTFRLADSIPEAVAQRWHDEREQWLRARNIDPAWRENDPSRWSKAYSSIARAERDAFEREQQHKFFVELDRCHGNCLLGKTHRIVAGALEFFHGQRVWTGDFVVMPNHVHVIVQPFPGVKLEEWSYSIKRFTSTEIDKDAAVDAHRIGRRAGGRDIGMSRYVEGEGQTRHWNAALRGGREGTGLWQAESFDRIVRDAVELGRIRRYIARNPAKLRPGTFALKQMSWLDEFAQTVALQKA